MNTQQPTYKSTGTIVYTEDWMAYCAPILRFVLGEAMNCAQVDRAVGVSENGSSAAKDSSKQERDGRGRFAKGNPGGPGNPYARQVAALRRALHDVLTPETMLALAGKLLEMAMEGNVQAAKLLFSYAIGKPAASVNPDTLAMQEMEQFAQEADAIREGQRAVHAPDPNMAAELLRVTRECSSKRFSQNLMMGLSDPEKFEAMVDGEDDLFDAEEEYDGEAECDADDSERVTDPTGEEPGAMDHDDAPVEQESPSANGLPDEGAGNKDVIPPSPNGVFHETEHGDRESDGARPAIVR